MFLPGPLWFLFCFWQMLFPLWEELAGKRVTAGGRTEQEWLMVLKRREKGVLNDAVMWSGELHIRAAVPELLSMLQDEKYRSWGNIRISLAEIGPSAPELIPGLLRILEKDRPEASYRALEVLSLLEPETLKPLLPRLLAYLEKHRLDDEAEKALFLVKMILRGTTTPLPLLKSLLQHRLSGVRLEAMGCIPHRPELAGQVTLIEERLQDADAEVRRDALSILSRLAARGNADLRYFMQDLLVGDWRPLYQLKENLEHLGPRAPSLRPKLLAALEQTKGNARVNVAAALWRLDGNLRALEVLFELSRDTNKNVRGNARVARAFRPKVNPALVAELRARWFGDKRDVGHDMTRHMLVLGKPAEPLLAEALRDNRRDVRFEALRIIWLTLGEVTGFHPVLREGLALDLEQEEAARELAPLIPPLLLHFCRREQEPDLQYSAALLLWKRCENPGGLTYLCVLMDEEKVPVALRVEGIQSFPPYGPHAELYQVHLLRALKSKHAELRLAAARKLGESHKVPPLVVQAVVDALRDDELEVQQAAAEALGSWGAAAQPAVPGLERLLDASSAPLRKAAITALARVSSGDARLRSRLRPLLEHGSKDQRLAVLDALCGKSELARGEVPLLLQLLRDPDLEIRRYVLYVLQRIGPLDLAIQEAIVPLLDHPVTSGAAAYALRHATNLTPTARAGLQRLLFSRPGETRFTAALILYEHTRNPLAFAILRNGVRDLSEGTKRDAIHFMKQLGPAARVIKPELLAILRQRTSYLTVDAATALWQIDRDPEALTALVRMMQDKEGSFAEEAGRELVNQGADAKTMEPALRKLLDHPQRHTRDAARMVLERLPQAP